MFPIEIYKEHHGASQVNHSSASRLPFQSPGEVVSEEVIFPQPLRRLEGTFLVPPQIRHHMWYLLFVVIPSVGWYSEPDHSE